MLVPDIQHSDLICKLINMISLVRICHLTKRLHSYSCIPHTVSFIPRTPLFCSWQSVPPYPELTSHPHPQSPLRTPVVSDCFRLVTFVHLFFIFRFNIQVKSYSICLLLSDLHVIAGFKIAFFVTLE